MLRRNLNSDFVGGAYVFPGGAVDPEDRHADLERDLRGPHRRRRLRPARHRRAAAWPSGWPPSARASRRPACCWPTTPTATSSTSTTPPASSAGPTTAARSTPAQRRLVEVCAEEGLRLAVDGMHYFGHWITPEGAPRRYDTRFFLAAAPAEPDAAARRPRGHRQRLDPPGRRPGPRRGRRAHDDAAHHRQPPGHRPLRHRRRGAGRGPRDHRRARRSCPGSIADDGGVRIVLPGDPDYDGEHGRRPTPSIDWMTRGRPRAGHRPRRRRRPRRDRPPTPTSRPARRSSPTSPMP